MSTDYFSESIRLANEDTARRQGVIDRLLVDLDAVQECIAILESALLHPPRGVTEEEMQVVTERVVDMRQSERRALHCLHKLL